MKILKESKNDIELFFRTTIFTCIIISCVAFVWYGSCSVFEAAQNRLFGDDRPAIVVDSEYVKIFELELYF